MESKPSVLQLAGYSKKYAPTGLGKPSNGLIIGIQNILYHDKGMVGGILDFSHIISSSCIFGYPNV